MKRAQVFAFDLEVSNVVDQKTFDFPQVTSVCEGPTGIVFSGKTSSHLVTVSNGALKMEQSSITCSGSTEPLKTGPECAASKTVFRGQLPGRLDQLSICYAPRTAAPDFHITKPGGERISLGRAGRAPGGNGRFVVTRGLQQDTFLVHHSRSSIAESAVLVDVLNGTLKEMNIPDLSKSRTSRGFGAGRFGIRLHEIKEGYLAASESGQIYLLKNGKTQEIDKEAVADSVFVFPGGCEFAFVKQQESGKALRVYTICA